MLILSKNSGVVLGFLLLNSLNNMPINRIKQINPKDKQKQRLAKITFFFLFSVLLGFFALGEI